MYEIMKSTFNMQEIDADTYSPLTLAYMGDCAYEITIRCLLVHKGNAPVNTLNKKGSELAKAETQSKMITALADSLSEEELAVYKRGRNAKSYSSAKNATMGDYRRATGFEALIGWLYLKGRHDRMMEIIKSGFEAIEADVIKN